MRIRTPALLLLAAVVGGATIASKWHQRRHRNLRDQEYTTELKSWENEGGHLAPIASGSVPR